MRTLDAVTIGRVAELAGTDGELSICGRGWNGRLVVGVDDRRWAVSLVDGSPGEVNEVTPDDQVPGDVSLLAAATVWEQLLKRVPAPGFTDPWAAGLAGLRLLGGPFSAERHAA